MNSSRLFVSVLGVAAAFLVGCGGGSGDSPATGTLPTSSPPPAGVSTFTLSPNVQTLLLPVSAGFTGSVSVPGATTGTGTNVQIVSGISPPLGTPIMQGSAIGNQQAPIPLFYMAMTPSAAVQLGGAPAFSLTLPSYLSTSGFNFYVGYFDPSNALNGYQLNFEGPAAINGQTVSIAESTQSLSLKSAATYSFSLYEIPIPSPSPTP